MQERITLHDKSFVIDIPHERILEAVGKIAEEINQDLDGTQPLFIGVLNGAFMFLADLMKHMRIPCEITFVRVASYEGTSSTGQVKSLVGLAENIKDRTVVIVEDIVDTGNTIQHLYDALLTQQPRSIRVATLLLKPDSYQKDVPVDYAALVVPNDFLVGYGLDYDGLGRNLKHIYKISE